MVNRVFEETIGVSVIDVLGKSATDWADSDFARAYIEHDHEVISKGATIVQEEIVPYADGTLHTHIATKVFQSLMRVEKLVSIGGINTDITERKRAEEAIKTREEMLRSFMDNSPSTIILKDLDARYLMVNRSFEQERGKSADETHRDNHYQSFIPENTQTTSSARIRKL